MSTCHSCNSEILKPDFRFCPYCGIEFGLPVICPTCGYENESNSKFCHWNFIESWGDETGGLVVTTNKFGIKQQVVMNGVGPTRGAIKEIAKKVGGLKIRA